MRLNIARACILLTIGLGAGDAGAGQEGTDMRLEDMGFVMRTANTPEQLARLRVVPPRKFLVRNKNGRRYYIYADPDYCQCVFLGDERAMQNYKNLVSPFPRAPTVVGSGDLPPTIGQQMIDEVDPGLTFADDDILNY
ncbi:MAG: hypothetical protein KGK33_10300 [Hyphomicrobiales bacterium]|nr:hypothetical protein [Hyphomicrobiales bacterium]